MVGVLFLDFSSSIAGLPMLGRELAADQARTLFTLFAFVIGFAGGQLLSSVGSVRPQTTFAFWAARLRGRLDRVPLAASMFDVVV